MRQYLLGTLLLVAVSVVNAQTRRVASTNGISQKKVYDRNDYLPFTLSIKTGITQFFGELNEQDMRGVSGVSIGRAFNKNVSLHLDYHSGKLGGQKSAFFNSWFVNVYNSAELTAKWNLTEQFNQFEPGKASFSIYGGLGIIHFNAHAYDLDNNQLLRFTNSPLSARNPHFLRWGRPKSLAKIKKTREGILPLGTSLDYKLLKHWKIGLDYRFYFVRTDKLDATSGMRLINPEESESYSDTPNDKFSFIAVTLAYRFHLNH
ncbi:outer membrane beta-barrel protein [Dyadobacter psychrophilus]|uniref:Outer membrane protein beta-barrel domain-containing protein n=1 Tax=Dyadobacter psychrophilus TaxID=651661 RepID=A0A1T5H506_9BACT|nr:outer membrane beta-barrel protein [Dyadobacter psychrophilus]SKC15767.1 Outer membrane protein beta-barrel domain-containing protein [Dyadobacter psychrophilus]